MTRRRKILVATLLGFTAFLALETVLPAQVQPSARVCLALIDGYQAVGSPVLRETGVRCKYTPSCSHYAEDAIGHFGTVEGCLRTGGRLLRCSPWGGTGYDPAFEEISRRQAEPPKAEPAQQEDPNSPPQQKEGESDEEYRRRVQQWQQKQAEEAMRKIGEALGEGGAEAATGCAIAGVGCFITVIVGSIVALGGLIFSMIWVYKDAKARNDQNSVIWLLLLFFIGWPIGLVIYILARPKGELAPCASCNNSMMTTLTKCPHCGTESEKKA